MKKILIIIILVLSFSGDIVAQRKYIIRFATLAPVGSTWMNILNELNEEIQIKTDNQMRFKIYPGGVQGEDLDVVRKMRKGQIDCAGLMGEGMGDILPEIRVLELPFLFENVAEIDSVVKKLFSDFYRMFEEKGYILLGWAEVGFVYVFSNIPIKSPEDMKNAKMWMMEGDPLAEEIFNVFGITSIPLPITDVLTSLKNNQIDAFYSPPYGAIIQQWFTKVNYMTDIPLAYAAGAVLITKKCFDRLPAEYQNILEESCKIYLRKLVEETRKDNEGSIKVLKEKGKTKIVDISDESEIDYFKSLSFKVQKNLVNKLYSQETLDLVLNALKEFRNSKN